MPVLYRLSVGVAGFARVLRVPLFGRPAASQPLILWLRSLYLWGFLVVRLGLYCLPFLFFLLWRYSVFSQPGIVAVAGSRNISASGSALIIQITSVLAASGFSFVVGCCSGADAALLSAVPESIPPSFVHCLAAFNAKGMGAAPSSAIDQVFRFSACGGSVEWLTGGSLSVFPWVRLANRTKQVIHSANAGLLVFFSSPRSRGSVLACRCAIARGIPIVAFPMGFPSTELPRLGLGYWVKNTTHTGYLWVNKQQDIFK